MCTEITIFDKCSACHLIMSIKDKEIRLHAGTTRACAPERRSMIEEYNYVKCKECSKAKVEENGGAKVPNGIVASPGSSATE